MMARRSSDAEPEYNRLNMTDGNMLLTSTITKPNMEKLIKAISLILLDQMEEDVETTNKMKENQIWSVFDEENYLNRKSRMIKGNLLQKLTRKPNAEDIDKFITALYETAEYSAECNVLCLLYINRLIAFSGLPLHLGNWRPLVFTALIVAQKVWDDKYLGNSEFACIYPFFSLEEINQMEMNILQLLQYQVTVKPSTYAKYYFELRSFSCNPDDMPIAPLNNVTAERLERKSAEYGMKCEKINEQRSMTTFM